MNKNPKTKNRAISVSELETTKFATMAFEGKWESFIGLPERSGAWLIWGSSGNGKTRFALQLAKYLSNFGKVAYNPLEEGISLSLRKACKETRMSEVKKHIIFLDKEPIAELEQRLIKRKSPDIIIIDSVQYTGMKYSDYIRLKDKFRNKLFILISHAEGKEPAGRVAKSIRFDVSVKIRIEGYKASPVSRYGGGDDYIIWDEGAYKYWGDIL